jgi:hypothetical protein
MANPGDLTARAVAAAVAVAAEHGLRTTEPAVLAAPGGSRGVDSST